MNKEIKIIIVDDHAIFRDGLRFLLSQIYGFKVISEAENGIDLLKQLNTQNPDLILMDISMPKMDGIEATEKALQKNPNIKVIALSSYSDHVYYYKMIKAGVQGFVLKKTGKDELEKAINIVYKGGNYFPQDVLRNMIFNIGNKGIDSICSNKIILSKREQEVLYLICQGHTNNEIGESLHISPKTVDNHRTKLLSKTSTKNSAHLVMFAITHHLVEV